MHSLQKQFHDFILSKQLVKKGEKLLLAVSGGVDSMVLADLFVKDGFEVALAHCNFGLRGEESDGDEAFVMEWADKRGINCFVKSFDLEGSIQLEARNARYQWFNELLIEHGLDKIATAHHLNDSLETVLINLSRGTGLKGLTGVPLINEKIIRPLSFASKNDIYKYAMDVGLEWREDSSNKKDDYDRNQIRHHVVPELEKVNPSLLKSFISTQERLSHANKIITNRVAEIKQRFIQDDRGGVRIDLTWISDPSDELILAEILAEFGLNYQTAKEVFEARGKSGKSFSSGEWFLTMDRSELFIDKGQNDTVELEISGLGSFDFGNASIELQLVKKDDVVFESENVAYLDYDKLRFPLSLRNWNEGDRFQPLGMNGKKKVSDFLIDIKIPLAKKHEVFVMESKGEICWVVGYRISDSFKVTNDSTSILKVSFSPPESP
ncbi:tRNA lysidine(34) synthetase TilS [Ekhidna sp.]|uniref:tRNA lysidine(34) synthetase TilS n=1 Tax=Ekhidna sp. TaxID=2608089 RepID=UPI003CCB8B3C